MSFLSWLFGPKPQPIDGTARFMNDLDAIIRRACEDEVSDFVIDDLLKSAMGRRRWHPRDIYADTVFDDQPPRDLRELLLRRNDRVI
jgi:hypothetical protein